ncbi:IPT/TIG domain-containing protein [Streptomyces caniferus]|uniref:IPT/TIG domain-containing protein n=1 Tax=Streptomyces caniferus TaxID=285557 RepID=UPI002E2CFA6D|nr:IPT/TIG domain-containing protein [Streptomyces caniferus]
MAGGATVTLTGRGLDTATSVGFGATNVTPTVVSDSELTVVSPAHAAESCRWPSPPRAAPTPPPTPSASWARRPPPASVR